MKHMLTIVMGSMALSVAASSANAASLQLENRLNGGALDKCAFNNNHHSGWSDQHSNWSGHHPGWGDNHSSWGADHHSGWGGHRYGWGGGEKHHHFDRHSHSFGNGMNGSISGFNGLGGLVDLSSLLQSAGGAQTGAAAGQVTTNNLSHVIASQSSYSNQDQAYINLLQLQLSGSITPQGGITWNDIFTTESIALINNEQSNQSSFESLTTNSTNAEGYTIFNSGQ